MKIVAVYKDEIGVARVWGEADNKQEAIEQAALALEEYRQHRPDKTDENFTLDVQAIVAESFL